MTLQSNDNDISTHGIFTNSSNRRKKICLHFADTAASLFLVSPLAISYWRVTWAYIEYIIRNYHLNLWLCFFGAAILHTIIAMLRSYFYETYEDYKMKDASKIAVYMRKISTKCYAYVFSIICITNWLAAWALLDIYYGMETIIYFFAAITNY